MVERIRKIDLFRIFCRCFLIQASWNFKSMLGLGFCYSTIPIAKRLYKKKDDQSKFLKRHLEFFNAHPYFAAWCLGAVAKLEEDAQLKKWDNKKPISIFKERMVGPLGAIGDQYFWAGVKPVAAGIGVLLGLLIGWLAIPLYLLIYNIPHIYIRARGLSLGYKKGFDIISDISVRKFQKIFKVFTVLGLLVTGLTTAKAAIWSLSQDFSGLIVFSIAVFVTLLFLFLKRTVILALFISILIGIIYIVFLNYSI
ncbi:PTS system mannose/fructose/sorbose family transporter subunit IID [candidate division KSB1 bacterium]|nr:PTS system mannose/fructose/sorbose family transporter subunit IID [candidate division KSB1 bacterium]